ncbi:hypothetical protein D1825_12700 [Cellulomonas rhizosphaerae]|uniref:Uncharacterized protein n=1 Tax=Cellulomonas rhizosphaerae TaxID=2293719 RepID=A0A413RJW2_9CELL|nr:hypothetical protein D1825_12700 [Cellulomonas rhizosphaerae]
MATGRPDLLVRPSGIRDEHVVALSRYEMFDDQQIEREMFAELLHGWRSDVGQHGSASRR